MQELDSIVARALRVAEFFDSIDPKRTLVTKLPQSLKISRIVERARNQ
jgi:hypothetical protein